MPFRPSHKLSVLIRRTNVGNELDRVPQLCSLHLPPPIVILSQLFPIEAQVWYAGYACQIPCSAAGWRVVQTMRTGGDVLSAMRVLDLCASH